MIIYFQISNVYTSVMTAKTLRSYGVFDSGKGKDMLSENAGISEMLTFVQNINPENPVDFDLCYDENDHKPFFDELKKFCEITTWGTELSNTIYEWNENQERRQYIENFINQLEACQTMEDKIKLADDYLYRSPMALGES